MLVDQPSSEGIPCSNRILYANLKSGMLVLTVPVHQPTSVFTTCNADQFQVEFVKRALAEGTLVGRSQIQQAGNPAQFFAIEFKRVCMLDQNGNDLAE